MIGHTAVWTTPTHLIKHARKRGQAPELRHPCLNKKSKAFWPSPSSRVPRHDPEVSTRRHHSQLRVYVWTPCCGWSLYSESGGVGTGILRAREQPGTRSIPSCWCSFLQIFLACAGLDSIQASAPRSGEWQQGTPGTNGCRK